MSDKTAAERKSAAKNFIFRYAAIILGCVIYSFGVALFLDIYSLAAGGVTGIAIIIASFLPAGFPLTSGWIIVLINVPLFVLGAIFFGKNFTFSTLFSTVLSSALIELWAYLFKNSQPLTDDIFIAAIVGGVLYGGGLGLIFRMGSTTGGTDIIVKILRKKFRHIKSGIISMVLDVMVVCVSAIVFRDQGFNLIFYTVLSIVAFTVTFDFVLYGGNSAKLVHIITTDDKAKIICDKVMRELDITATCIDGEGAYSGEDKRIVVCAVKNYLYPKLRDVVKVSDPKAFMIVGSAKEIYGEGYKPHDGEDL